jgi:adenine phosphoribosyltransferase
LSDQYLKSVIRTIPHYPKSGIMFRDVTTLIQDAQAFAYTIDKLASEYENRKFDKIAGAEARGFIFGAPLALKLGVGFVPLRKPNKLPGEILSEPYQLEYGESALEVHIDAIDRGDKVLLVDDLLATGGTMLAAASLVAQLGGTVQDAGFVVSLPELQGESRLEQAGIRSFSLCSYEGE